jgi:hypothetical protein
VTTVATRMKKATGQQERDDERKKGASLLKMVAQATAKKIEERAKQEQIMKNASWKEWLATELGGHAAGAFGFVKLPTEWQPQTEQNEEGEREESEVATISREQEEYAKLWQTAKGEERRRNEAELAGPAGGPSEFEPTFEPSEFERATPDQIRKAAKKCKKEDRQTSGRCDGDAPDPFAPDGGP